MATHARTILAAALLGAAITLTAPAVAGAAGTVSVFPIPGGHYASPQTQITIRGVSASQIGTVTVTGSASGVHTGHIAPDSDGDGGSFIPDQPFAAGETVSVSTGLTITGSSSGNWSFTVANPASPFPVLHWPPASRGKNDVQFFHSRPDLSPVSVTVTKQGATRDGDIFVAPQWGPVEDGPMILDPNGNLVWFDNMKGHRGDDSATDFRVQSFNHKSVLTWWEGTLVAGIGLGQDVIFDNTYRQIATVTAGNGMQTDEHEFEITPQGTALITTAYPVYVNAQSIGGSTHQLAIDMGVQEIDIPTGLVLFQWDALDHVALGDSYEMLPRGSGPYDAYHLNAVDVDRDGNFIISARNTWAAYKVDRHTAATLWVLGGKHSSFRLAKGTHWEYQHDVRVRSQNDQYLTLFDDAGGPPHVYPQSRGLKLKLDTKHMTAQAIQTYGQSPTVATNYEGNTQQLGNGDVVLGWGQKPLVTEYDSRGDLLFGARLNSNTASYRAYRFAWSATPWNKPAVAAGHRGHGTVVYASWNGATTVASWRVLGGGSSSSLRSVATARKGGFETAITAPAEKYVAVQALDRSGHVLSTSPTVGVR